jgi:putative hydrolase of HD superfamily
MPDSSRHAHAPSPGARIASQLAFVVEIDRLKSVLRQTSLCDGTRRENSAEHSWHLAVMAAILAEHAGPGVDVPHVIRMLLVHDLVEIDAGDTFAFDVAANVGREARERTAAERLFGLLPPDQDAELRALWEEFEAQATPSARFAAALDRMQPLLNNHGSNGGSWRTHAITRAQVLARMRPIEAALPALWSTVMDIVDANCACGNIREDG